MNVHELIRETEADPLLTPKEVGEYFRVGPKTITLWASRGQLPYVRSPGGRMMFRRSVIEAALDATVEKPNP